MKITCKFLLILFLIIITLIACKNKNESENSPFENIEIDISKSKNNPSNVFSKIKIIPLHTSDTVLLNRIKSVNFFDNKYYVVIDKNLIVHIFDKNGDYISNSGKKIGVGPEDYYTINDAIYNRFTDKFELLGYDNSEIITYDKYFNFIKRVKVKTKERLHFSSFIALSKYEYILTPSLHESMDNVIIYNVNDNKSEKLKVEGNIAKLTMTETPFKYSSNHKTLYFTPISLNYSIFAVNTSTKQLDKKMNINIVKNQIEESKLKGFKTDHEISDYLFNSSFALPLRNLVNDKYLVSIILKDKDLYTFTHSRESGLSNITKNKYKSDLSLPLFFTLEDDALYSLINSFDVNKCVDKNLLDESDKKLLEKIDEDSNPVIVIYYLK